MYKLGPFNLVMALPLLNGFQKMHGDPICRLIAGENLACIGIDFLFVIHLLPVIVCGMIIHD